MDKLQRSLRQAPVVEIDGYQYFVHPITDGVPMLEPSLLREVVIEIIRTANFANVDKIVTPAAMGIHISTAVSLITDIPVVVIRKRRYRLDGEIALFQETGYDENQMYLNDVDEGDRVLVLDDVLSTGGTLKAVIAALEGVGATIVDVVVVIKKVGGEDKLSTVDRPVKTLVSVDVKDGQVVIVDSTKTD